MAVTVKRKPSKADIKWLKDLEKEIEDAKYEIKTKTN